MPPIPPLHDNTLDDRVRRWISQLRQILQFIPRYREGNGSPEGVLDGVRGDRFYRLDGGAGTTLYYKSTNGGNTGWRTYG